MNFEELSKSHLEDLVTQLTKREFDIKTINSASHIIHEASHYFDHMATLSGQHLLLNIYDALNDYSSNSNKYNILDLFNTLSSWKHDYFNTSIKRGIYDPDYNNWQYQFGIASSKNASNNKLFVFATFKYRGEEIAKVPFSIEALWETNAMWAEITYNINLAHMMKNEDEMQVEYCQIQNKYTSYTYNSDLLIYSFAAHITSSFLGLGDLSRAFILSKALSSISLNLPYQYYSRIKRPKGAIFEGLTNALLAQTDSLDPCVIFLTLLENLYESGVDLFQDDFLLNIDQILEANELPDKKVLKVAIMEEMKQLNINLDNAPFSKVYNQQKEHGMEIFKRYGIEGGLNIHPACFINIADTSGCCVFQQDMDWTTGPYKRLEDYMSYEEDMRLLVKEWRKNQSFDPTL